MLAGSTAGHDQKLGKHFPNFFFLKSITVNADPPAFTVIASSDWAETLRLLYLLSFSKTYSNMPLVKSRLGVPEHIKKKKSEQLLFGHPSSGVETSGVMAETIILILYFWKPETSRNATKLKLYQELLSC